MKVLETSIEKLPSTSKVTIARFKKIGISTFFDLLNYFPYKYKDYSNIKRASKSNFGEVVTVKGTVISKKEEISKRGLRIQLIELKDDDTILLVWFNQPYILHVFKKGDYISVSGEVKPYFMQKAIFVEEFEILKNSDESIHTGRIVPYYPEKNKLSSKVIREKIFYILSQDPEFYEILPEKIIRFNNLLSEADAYKNIHFPSDNTLKIKARQRLAFDELFTLQLSSKILKIQWEKEKKAPKLKLDAAKKQKLSQLISSLPFELTSAQKKALYEIINDFRSGKPMNRFLHGDVGAGKTVVAALSSYIVALNGYQTLFMAPTEILAVQHFKTFKTIFANTEIKIGLQTRTNKVIELKEDSSVGEYDIIIGTHALIQEKLKFERVGFVVIDEQQRFGVLQRAMLRKKGLNPHLLTMTATPIPRTAALVLYGELDISVLDEMPKNRKPVKTFLVPKEKRPDAYEWIKKKVLEEEMQVFVVCPLIQESDKETMKNVKAATKEYEVLTEVFKGIPVGLLHGKMKGKEKEKIIEKFKNREIMILVTTPVIEVGVDIPNANIIVIETAERYGLAQLHQLRGRVGRSDKQGYCLIFTETNNKETLERLKFFQKTTDGFKLSEYDLKHRGPGEVFGTRQHGFINVKIASLLDYKLIEKTSKAVEYFIKYQKIEEFPELKQRIDELQANIISRD